METFKIKVDDVEKEIIVREPTREDIEGAEKARASKVTSILKSEDLVLSRYEIEDYLRKNKIWTDGDQESVDTKQTEIEDAFKKLRKGGMKASKGRTLCIKIFDLRTDILQILSKRQSFDDSTIENQSENEYINYLAYSCTLNSDGDKYWPSFLDYKDDLESDAALMATRQTYKNLFGETNDVEKNLPENKWLQKYGFLNSELRLIDRKTGALVDREGNPVQELEPDLDGLEDMNGDILSDEPFIDDDTNEPITFKKTTKKKTVRKKKTVDKKKSD